ncbi:MAG TPA: nucleotidyltransferase family protein [Gaiellaceae bacterium]|nr:nucleotidyltransferase family protein [Gaiellaceae bacterium]
MTIREAIVLAGGKAERLGEAAGGRPKSLVRVGESPLLAYQVALLVRAGVDRLIVSCAAGQGGLFADELSGLGAEIVPVEEPEPLGRGGGLRFACSARRDEGDVYAQNGDELVDLDLRALAEQHGASDAAATITVVPLESHLGIVDLDADDTVLGFREKPRLPHWVSCGVYVLGEEALARLPERGDHETTTFPALAAERKLRAFRHEGIWLTVNTPKDLRIAAEHVATNPSWLEAS